jgi:hypothetical protein
MSSLAAHQVLGITELLEQVLANLPYADVIRLLRVSKHINAVIQGSMALRKILWFDVDPDPVSGIPTQLLSPADRRRMHPSRSTPSSRERNSNA